MEGDRKGHRERQRETQRETEREREREREREQYGSIRRVEIKNVSFYFFANFAMHNQRYRS